MLNFRRALNGDLLSMEKKTEEDVSVSKVCVPFVAITRKRTRAESEAEGGRDQRLNAALPSPTSSTYILNAPSGNI